MRSPRPPVAAAAAPGALTEALLWILGKDKGGPSKGGFLNNILFS